MATTRFAKGVPFAEDVFRLYEQGVLRGWSIGLVPKKARPRNGGRGLQIDAWDLLEYSAVPVPESPAALTLAINDGVITDEWLRRHLLRLLNSDPFASLVA